MSKDRAAPLPAAIRGLLRGLQPKSQNRAVQLTTFNRLRAACDDHAILPTSRQLFSSPLYNHLNLFEPFPARPRNLALPERFRSLSLRSELSLQLARIEANEKKLHQALDDLRFLNERLLDRDWENALSAADAFRANYGYSFLLLAKYAYMAVASVKAPEVYTACISRLALYGLSNRNVLPNGIFDIMDTFYGFYNIRRIVQEFARGPTIPVLVRDLISYMFRPIQTDAADMSSQLQTHGSMSLIDVLVFIMVNSANVPALASLGVQDIIDEVFPHGLKLKWTELSDLPLLTTGIVFDEGERDARYKDVDLYRRSIAWIECKDVATYRNSIDDLYLEPSLSKVPLGHGLEKRTFYFSRVETIERLFFTPGIAGVALNQLLPGQAGILNSTLGFVDMVRGGLIPSSLDSSMLIRILGTTTDIANLLSVQQLRAIASFNRKDYLLQYLVQALINDQTRSDLEQHRLRRILQDYVRQSFGSDLVKFVVFLHQQAKSVAQHFYNLCNESFLVQLYILFDEPSLIYETRARLHDWYADAFSEPVYKDRAKALRLDQRLLKIRGQIDDTRIYVDPIRYQQWAEDNLIEEITGLFRAERINDEAVDCLNEAGDYLNKRLPHVRLALVLQRAFEEFCSNKQYGIASYLGRRIRHGTLKGFMTVEMEWLFAQERFSPLHQGRYDYLASWRTEFETEIATWGSEDFQISGKTHPKGMFVLDVFDQSKLKILRRSIREVNSKFLKDADVFAALQLITEYCWMFAEVDLVRIRSAIEHARVKWGTLNRGRLLDDYSADLRELAVEFDRELAFLNADKFKTLARWFTKPTNLAPSAPVSLLFQATLQEVKQHFPAFDPRVVEDGLTDIELVGTSYHHLYDFLYVVIFNAAKHGRKQGTIKRTIDVAKDDRLHEYGSVLSARFIVDTLSLVLSKEAKDAVRSAA